MQEYAAGLGYRIEPVVLSDFSSIAEAGRKLRYRGIEGLLVMALFNEATVREFPWDDFCAVSMMAGYFRPPVPIVMPDRQLSMMRAVEEAFARGYRRPGLALLAERRSPLDDLEKHQTLHHLLRQPAYRSCARLPLLESSDATGEQFMRWVKAHRPDVVIGQTGWFHWLLTSNGFRVPEDCGFISLEVYKDQQEAQGCAGFVLDVELLTGTAIQLLDAKLRHFDHSRLQMAATLRVELPWREGSTLPVRMKTGGP
jgi:DNA-binding LacI/PurR family transcriptional regulator